MSESSPDRAGLRRDIQGMRALAVGLVVLGHAGFSALPGGYVGVDVFFVISGFLITGLIAKEFRTEGRISISGFYARRARRILPAATVTLIVVAIASAFVYTSGRLHQVLEDTIWATFFGSNIHYATAGTGYFDNDNFVSPVLHFWSLAVEEQFLVVWPLAIGGCGLVAAAVHRALRKNDCSSVLALRFAILLIAVLCTASLLWAAHATDTEPASAYFSTLTRAYELGAGALLALTVGRLRLLPDVVKAGLSWGGLAAIGVAAVVFEDSTPFPGTAALLPVLGAVALIAGGTSGPRYGAEAILGLKPFQLLGDISYSLYLWHWPLLILPAAYLERDLRGQDTAAAVAVALTIAALSYRYVETPFRHRNVTGEARRRVLRLWPVGFVLVLATVGGVRAVDAYQSASAPVYQVPKVDPEPATRQTSPDQLVRDVGFAAELSRSGYPLPATLRPSLADLPSDITPASGYQNNDATCFATRVQVTSRVCVTGDKKGSKTIVALGDSHMGMWLAPVTRLAQEKGYRVVTMLKQRCLPFAFTEYDPVAKGAYTQCNAYRASTLKQIEKLKPDMILVSGLYAVDIVDPRTGAVIPRLARSGEFEAGIRRSITELRKLSPRVLVLGPTPLLPTTSSACLASRRATMAACKDVVLPTVLLRNRQLRTQVAAARGRYLNVLPWFCDTKMTCPVVVRDVIVYRDGDHITQTYAEQLEPVIARFLQLR